MSLPQILLYVLAGIAAIGAMYLLAIAVIAILKATLMVLAAAVAIVIIVFLVRFMLTRPTRLHPSYLEDPFQTITLPQKKTRKHFKRFLPPYRPRKDRRLATAVFNLKWPKS
jgi:hypothetical protein